MRLLSITTSVEELHPLIPILRDLYFNGKIDGFSLVRTASEAELKSNPWVCRRMREFCVTPLPLDTDLAAGSLVSTIKIAVSELRPNVVLWPMNSSIRESLQAFLKDVGVGQYTLNSASPPNQRQLFDELKNRSILATPRETEGLNPKRLFEGHWEKLAPHLESPCLLLGHQILVKECRRIFPEIDFHSSQQLERYPSGVSLFELSLTDRPDTILTALRDHCQKALLVEPVNTQLVGSRFTLRYLDYDNEKAHLPAEMDLHALLGDEHETEIWNEPLHHPLFATRLKAPEGCWTAPYQLPAGESLKIVFADSGNVAGSILHHAEAINRFTDSKAWAVALAPHPFIGPREETETTFFTGHEASAPSDRLHQVLSEADCFVFFEDDDEQSAGWPFPLQDYVAGKAVLHLYIGYRVHTRTPELQRRGRRILSPLPHILKMYPEAHFYAGFPPIELIDTPLEAPRSAVDGICRILHTPSMPHWTTSRYPYHKDTEAFMRSARKLKKRFGDLVEFHQIGGWSHQEVLRARQVCDVTFNQLRGFHGLSGDEAMWLGRTCVQAFDQLNINRHREYWGLGVEFPWLTVSFDSLDTELADLIQNPDRRASIGRLSREFMLKYFSPQKGILPLLYHCYQTIKGG